MISRNRSNITLVACTGVILASANIDPARAYDNADFIIESIERPLSVTSAPRHTAVHLPDGGVVRFIEISGDGAYTAGYAVVEVHRGQGPSIHDVPELADANPSQLFFAITERGTELPRGLVDAYGPVGKTRAQGWARDRLTGVHLHGGGGFACPQTNWSWNDFEALILGKNLPLIFLSEGDGPSTVPQHWFGMGGFVSNYDKLVGGVHDASAFTTSVLLCELDDQSRTFHPFITVRYRQQSVWQTAVSEEVFEAGEQVTFTWHPVFDPISGVAEIGAQYDFELWVSYALGIDKFYIGATWSKPFDTLKGN